MTGEGSAGGGESQRWARLWAAAQPHDVLPAGALGEYAALRARRGEAAARRAHPAVAAHLDAGCDACAADLADLETLVAEELSGLAEPGGVGEPALHRRLLAGPADFDALEAAPEARGARASQPLPLREAAARRYEAETLGTMREEQERYLRQFQRAWEEAQASLRAIQAAQEELAGLARQAPPAIPTPPPPAALGTLGGGRPARLAAPESPLAAVLGQAETLRVELAAIRAELAEVQAATRSLRRLALASSGVLLGAVALLAWLVLSQPRL